ncbi:hypothetical protein [Streptomyces sp. NPDC007083]|uniref:hypothetical protein n=1 Tax=unclassified Streptomyces TaxID=2593676 RepID=UPI0034021552
MPLHIPPPARHTEGSLRLDHLLAAAVRLTQELRTSRPTLGILRGWSRSAREQARMLRHGLASQGIRSTELSPGSETSEPAAPGDGQRHRTHLLVHAGGLPYDQALRTAALWDLPLLIERPHHEEPRTLNRYGARRRPVLGVHLPGDVLDIALRAATITGLRPHPGNAYLLLDNEKLSAPAGKPLQVSLTEDGELEVHSDTFAPRRVRRLRYERPWSSYRLDIDGGIARDVRAPLRLEAMPSRLHLLHP